MITKKRPHCKLCNLPSIPGLNTSLCQRHYNEHMWGKQWADGCVGHTKIIVSDGVVESIYHGIYPEEAVRDAYRHYVGGKGPEDNSNYNHLVKRSRNKCSCGKWKVISIETESEYLRSALNSVAPFTDQRRAVANQRKLSGAEVPSSDLTTPEQIAHHIEAMVCAFWNHPSLEASGESNAEMVYTTALGALRAMQKLSKDSK